jgi:hypothetical protein
MFEFLFTPLCILIRDRRASSSTLRICRRCGTLKLHTCGSMTPLTFQYSTRNGHSRSGSDLTRAGRRGCHGFTCLSPCCLPQSHVFESACPPERPSSPERIAMSLTLETFRGRVHPGMLRRSERCIRTFNINSTALLTCRVSRSAGT